MDANALMMPVECNVRVFEELERLLGPIDPVVPRAVVDELERLADHGDPAVLECATRDAVTHAVTNDAALKRSLLDAGVPVISLRARNKLAVTQP